MREYDAFGIHVSKKLAKMDPVQAVYAKSLISGNIRKGLLKTLTDDTDFCENVTFEEWELHIHKLSVHRLHLKCYSQWTFKAQVIPYAHFMSQQVSMAVCTINKMCPSYHVDDKLCNFVHNNKHLDS
jgi:ABC-type cobalamin transport system ATPase subunit